MAEEFVALDVETANADLASVCQIGLVTFSGSDITELWESLVNPKDEFDPINVSIHGIDEAAVREAPTFPEIAQQLSNLLSNQVVASHMPFDRLAVTRAHEKHRLRSIECTWLDTARVCRRAWTQFARRGYGLTDVASFCGIEFRHHNAIDDARAAGLVLLRAMDDTGLGLSE